MAFFFKTLAREHTAPFMLVSLCFSLLAATPFFYFTLLKSKVHSSASVAMEQQASPGTTSDTTTAATGITIEGGSNIPLNKFDHAAGSEGNDEEGDTETGMMPFIETNNVSDWKKDADSRGFIMLTRIAIFSIIFAFGALGAAISVITRTRNNDQSLNNFRLYEILSVQTAGGIFALVLGFAFMGNMIAGTLFPNPIVFTRILYVPPAFGKLLVWSFIAGFSERFVPNLLYSFSQKAEKTIE